MNGTKSKTAGTLISALGFLILSAFYFYFTLVPRESQLLKTLSVLGRYNLTRFLPVLVILLFIPYFLKKTRLSQLFIWAVTLTVYALALIGLWASAYSENYAIAGLVPRSDAMYNYGGALTYWLRGSLTGFASRRPLFSSFLAFLLWAFSGNLQVVLAALAFLSAIVSFAAFIQMRTELRPLGAIFFFTVIFLFMRRFIGLTMSEILGCMLGTASLTIWLYALNVRKVNERTSLTWFLVGTFVYMLAQMSRPAAAATLPLIVLFAGWLWRGDRKFGWYAAGWSLAVLALGFFINWLIYSLFGSQDAALMNNFGYGIYGLAVGGKGWRQIFFDFPELYTMAPGIRERTITQIIINQITRHPGDFLRGMVVQARILFSFSETNSLFSFTAANNTLANFALMGSLLLLLAAGFIAAIRRRKEPVYLLLLMLLAGMFLSLVVSPAYQTQYMRVFAASIPALAFGVGAGLSWIMEELKKRLPIFFKVKLNIGDPQNPIGAFSGVILAGIVILSPFLVRLVSPPLEVHADGCGDDQAEVVFLSLPGTRVTIFKDTPDRMTWVPYVSRYDYQREIHNICCDDDIAYYRSFLGGTEIFPTINLLDGSHILVVSPTGNLPESGVQVRACGRIENIYRQKASSGFFYPDHLEIIQP